VDDLLLVLALLPLVVVLGGLWIAERVNARRARRRLAGAGPPLGIGSGQPREPDAKQGRAGAAHGK
jgi:hypothetical protein